MRIMETDKSSWSGVEVACHQLHNWSCKIMIRIDAANDTIAKS